MQLALDPWITAQIDEVVAPYVGRLPARDVAWMREQLAITLTSDEAAAALLKGARPRLVEQSGEVASGGVGPSGEAAPLDRAAPAGRFGVVRSIKAR